MKLPGKGKNRYYELLEFAEQLIEIDESIDFKQSSRGWCYQLEGLQLVTKGEFNRVQNLINECRKNGLVPIDFVAEEAARTFHNITHPDTETPHEYIKSWIESTLDCKNIFTPDYWKDEKYYIQMLVEKVDLVSLFKPVCEEYFIPIATSKGWSSILQRAEIALRFQEMEEAGHIPILLYCGDFDPAGIGISDFLMKNFTDIELGTGWSPGNLIVDRFGLNYDFIIDAKLSLINNLETQGGYIAKVEDGYIVQGKTKTGRPHPDFNKPATQEYLRRYGVVKCEANALVSNFIAGRQLCRDAIEKYLGVDALDRFAVKKQVVVNLFDEMENELGITEPLTEALELLEDTDTGETNRDSESIE